MLHTFYVSEQFHKQFRSIRYCGDEPFIDGSVCQSANLLKICKMYLSSPHLACDLVLSMNRCAQLLNFFNTRKTLCSGPHSRLTPSDIDRRSELINRTGVGGVVIQVVHFPS